MSTPAVPAPGNPPAPSATAPRVDLFGDVWPEERVPSRPGVVAASLAVGLLAALVVPERDPGIGFALVALAMGTVAFVLTPRRPYLVASFALAVPLAAVGVAAPGRVDPRQVLVVLPVALVQQRQDAGPVGAGLAAEDPPAGPLLCQVGRLALR